MNSAGDLLLQHRDRHAPVGPGLWSTVGGAVEIGESPVEAAHRELAEETSLTGQSMKLWLSGDLRANAGLGRTGWSVFVGATRATDHDIVVGDGLNICFVPMTRIDELDLLPAARELTDRFLRSPELPALVCLAEKL